MQSKTTWFNFKMAACFVESNQERRSQNRQEDAQSDFFLHVSLGEEERLSWGLIFQANSRTWKKLFTKFFEDELLDMWKKEVWAQYMIGKDINCSTVFHKQLFRAFCCRTRMQ